MESSILNYCTTNTEYITLYNYTCENVNPIDKSKHNIPTAKDKRKGKLHISMKIRFYEECYTIELLIVSSPEDHIEIFDLPSLEHHAWFKLYPEPSNCAMMSLVFFRSIADPIPNRGR